MKKVSDLKKSRRYIFRLLACVILAMTILFGACGSTKEEAKDERTDEEIVRDAFENTFSETSGVGAALAKATGSLNLSGATETTVKLGLTDAGAIGMQDYEGASVSLTVQSDEDAGEGYLGAAFGLGSLEIDAGVYVNAEELSVGSNLLGDSVLTLDLTEDLLTQMEDSPLFSDYAEFLDADDLTDITDSLAGSAEFLVDFDEYLKEFANTPEYDLYDPAMSVTNEGEVDCVYDDVTVTATKYKISLSCDVVMEILCDYVDYLFAKDEFTDLLDEMLSSGYLSLETGEYTSAEELMANWESAKQELLDAAAGETVTMNVWVYEDRVISFDCLLMLTADGEQGNISATWQDYGETGKYDRKTVFAMEAVTDDETLLDLGVTNLESSEGMTRSQSTEFGFTADGSSTEMSLDLSYDTEEGAFSMDLALSGDEFSPVEISASGTVIGSSEDLLISLSDITYSCDGVSVSFSLYFYVCELEDGVTELEGTKIDVLEADEDDLTLLYLEIMNAVSNLDGLDDVLAMFGLDTDSLFGTGSLYDDYDWDDDSYDYGYDDEYDYDDDYDYYYDDDDSDYDDDYTYDDSDDYYSDDYMPETYDEFIAYVKAIMGEDYYEEYLIESFGEDYESVLKSYFGEIGA